MAGASLLSLIDDIAAILDDVALMGKVAAKKTAGVLGDDLALNAQQVLGVNAGRELPVVWAVAKGSLKNKAILVPAALLISAAAPWAVTPLLMAGGGYLCFEGFEKVAHAFLHRDRSMQEELDDLAGLAHALSDAKVDMLDFERDKIKGAVRTDFVLSAEIIAITLGVVASAPLMQQLVVLSGMAVAMTVGVYGIVAGIVRLDDAGLGLSQMSGAGLWRSSQRRLGLGLLHAAPWLMKALSLVGTAAMFMVGGGILMHGIPGVREPILHLLQNVRATPLPDAVIAALAPGLVDILAGIAAGAAVLAGVRSVAALRRLFRQ